MQFDENDVIKIEVSRDEPFAMSDHHPLIAGRLADGSEAYLFDLFGEDGLWYAGSGPTPETRFLLRRPDENLIFTGSSPSGALFVWVLRYDPDTYIHCEYYAYKMRSEEAEMDPTGPFSWILRRYLPAFFQAHVSPEVSWAGALTGGGLLSDIAEEESVSDCKHEHESESSEDVSLYIEDEDWQTAEEGSIVSRDVPYCS